MAVPGPACGAGVRPSAAFDGLGNVKCRTGITETPNLKLLVHVVHNILFRHCLIILIQRAHAFTPTEYAQLNRAVHSPSIMAFTATSEHILKGDFAQVQAGKCFYLG